ncbi:hypothetical protein C5S42_01675 [Candidatus Methanomarinus sp.]|nr:hypothetical protein C5S42_01675 [ANME-2 cluster archaeon]
MNTIKPKIYFEYPLLNVLIYNITTLFHFLLGGAGIILGYHSWMGNVLGTLYILFAFFQMYILMPLLVCPNCVYYRMGNSRCTSGMNLVSKKIAREGNVKDFPKRGEGVFCHNNLYMAALFLPIIAMIPALILDFSFIVLAIWFAVIGLLLFRFFVVFQKTACIHCAAKKECPNARAMGLDNKP